MANYMANIMLAQSSPRVVTSECGIKMDMNVVLSNGALKTKKGCKRIFVTFLENKFLSNLTFYRCLFDVITSSTISANKVVDIFLVLQLLTHLQL